MILEKLFEQYPKNISKIHRKTNIKLHDKTILYGAKNTGKTDFILNYFNNFEHNKMYINLNSPKFNPQKDLEELDSFCNKMDIQLLILDSFNNQIQKIPNINKTIIISQTPHNIHDFTNIEMPPITFKEYSKIHKYSSEESLTNYLKYGNLLEGESLKEYKKIEFLHTLANNESNFWILKNLILHLGSKVSTHQIYTKLKKEGKISKDRFYSYTKFLQDSKTLFLLEKLDHSSAAKKLYFYDFTLKNTISFDRNFSALFENMVFLEILYEYLNGNINTIFYTDKIDFYIPKYSLGIVCMPFIQNHILESKLNKISKEREFCEKFIIISLNQSFIGENLGTPYEVVPFNKLNTHHISPT